MISDFKEIQSQIKTQFPQLNQDIFGNPRIYLNNGGGTLCVDSAAQAMKEGLQKYNPQPGDVDPAETATLKLHQRVRKLIADFINAPQPEEISFHLSTTHALFNLAFSFRSFWSSKNNLVVTDLDHMANVSPWETLADEIGCEVRRARVHPEGCLDGNHLLSLVDENTALVALTLSSNYSGSIVPVKDLITQIHSQSSSLVCVDAVHHAAHGVIDVQDTDCDFLAFSGYKVFGPMMGVLWGKKELLEKMTPYRVETNRDQSPWKFEQGTLHHAVIASMEKALEYLLELKEMLNPEGETSRRDSFVQVMKDIQNYEEELSKYLLQELQELEGKGFYCHGITNPRRVKERDPTFSFEIEGISPEKIKRRLWNDHSIQIGSGNHYSAAVYRHLGKKSICRASFAHYDNQETADLFLKALEELLA